MKTNKQTRHLLTVGTLPLALWLILLLGFGLRLFKLGEQSLTWDEMSTVTRATIPLEVMFQNLFTVRNHVPLYFLIMRLWSTIGQDEMVLRYLSLLFGLLGIALIYRVGRLIDGRRVGLVAAFLLAISPFHIWYSQETRMYTLVAIAVLAANWFLIRLLRSDSRRDWIGYTLSMLIAVYTHYLAILILVAHYAFFSIHYRRFKSLFRRWIVYGAAVSLLIAIWLGMIMFTGGFTNSPIGWIAAANWFEPFLTFLSLSAGPSIDPALTVGYVTLLIFIASVLVCLLRINRRFRDDDPPERQRQILTVRLLFIWLVLPVFLVTLISLDWPVPQKRSIYMDRYLIIVLPALLLLVAWGLATVAQGQRRWLLPAALLAIVLSNAPTLRNLYGNPLYAREDWRAALAQIESVWRPDDILLIRPGQELPLYYYGDSQIELIELNALRADDGEVDFQEQAGLRLAELAPDSKRAWLITAWENANAHGFPYARNETIIQPEQPDRDENWLEEYGITVGQWTFTGIRLGLYELPER